MSSRSSGCDIGCCLHQRPRKHILGPGSYSQGVRYRAVLVESHRFPKAHTLAHKPFRPCLRPSAPPHHDSWGLGRLAQPLTVCIGDRPNSSPGTPRDLPAARCFHTCSFSLKSSNEQHQANSRTDSQGRHFVLLFIPITPIHPPALPLPHFQRGE